jgi:hypothetical protein
MTSLPAAPARKTLVVAPHRVDLSGRTVAVRVPAESVAIARAVALAGPQAEPQEGVGLSVMIEARLLVRAGVNGKVIAGQIVVLIVLWIAVLVAELTVRASGVARC